ncbi:unnamed protein product [Clavelina lepadiformis]|uniref:Transmembrane protein n=1 Tax=Clavelina lepadiformis TaxID=159417 RepID=A0ABP0GZ65_CLALP
MQSRRSSMTFLLLICFCRSTKAGSDTELETLQEGIKDSVLRDLRNAKYACPFGKYPAPTGKCESCEELCQSKNQNCFIECKVTFMQNYVLPIEKKVYEEKLAVTKAILVGLLEQEKIDTINAIAKVNVTQLQIKFVLTKLENKFKEELNALKYNLSVIQQTMKDLSTTNTVFTALGVAIFSVFLNVILLFLVVCKKTCKGKRVTKKLYKMTECTQPLRHATNKRSDNTTEISYSGVQALQDFSSEMIAQGPAQPTSGTDPFENGTASLHNSKFTDPKSSK